MPEGDDSISVEVSAPTPEPQPPPEAKKREIDPALARVKSGKPTNRACPVLNYAYAFALYASGMTPREIAAQLDMPKEKLTRKIEIESWPRLAREFAFVFKGEEKPKSKEDPQLEERFKRVEANRNSVVALATMLRGKIEQVARAFERIDERSLNDPEVLNNVTKSIGSLTKAAKDIADMTMIALGDEHIIRHLGAGFNAPNQKSGPSIVINMPMAMATSRRQMKLVGESVERAGGRLITLQNGDEHTAPAQE